MRTFFLRILLYSLFLLMHGGTVFSQTAIAYDYDANGNRISRHIVYLKSGSVVPADTAPKYEKEAEKEIQQEQLGELTLRIYPNPTHGEVVVETTGKDPQIQIVCYLFTSSGMLLVEKKQSSDIFPIDLSGYSNGMYILKIKIGEKVSEWKIIKQ
ncbi:MAG: T9SS type A sorting domain-containing protein [Bacteroidales bacterium]